MIFIMYFIFLFIKLGSPKDIKDLNFSELLELSKDTLRVRPYDVKEDDVEFYLFTRNISDVQLNLTTTGIMDTTKPVLIVIHGFIENYKRSWYQNITKEYLIHGDYNIIQINWERPSRTSYLSAAFNTRFVGYKIAEFLLRQEILLENIHVIGHSLGAHVAGFVGKKIKEMTGQKIQRITGLDPAGPYFKEIFITKNYRLDKSDAILVVNIHTDAGYYGYSLPLGSLDMYINGGSRIQPGCLESFEFSSIGSLIQDSFCSHARSCKYFTESINGGKFYCKECNSYEAYKNGQCDLNEEYVIGAEDITTEEGICYAMTKSNPPFLSQP